MKPSFLTLAELLEIHRDQIQRYGGDDSMRDLGLLQSAIAMPSATFDGKFLHADLYEMAAAYLFHIVQNHPFVDGNKRTGAVAAIVFLDLNGVELDADQHAVEALVLSTAQGGSDKAALAEFFRCNSHPIL